MSSREQGHGLTVQLDSITVWRTKLPDVKYAILPPHDSRPNPLVTDRMLYVSVFAPGAVCALDRETGKIAWRNEIPRLAGSAVHLAKGKLFAQTATTLYSLEPDTGATIWMFCPYGDSGEWIYSAPTIFRRSVFIGDRRGYLHCLDLRSGKVRWAQRTNKARNDDVNTTPIISNGLVIVGTNAKRAVAYEPETGKRVWTCALDGPSGFGPLTYKRLIAVFTDSVYLLIPQSGKVARKFSWRNDGITMAASTPQGIVAMLRGESPPRLTVELIGLRESGIRFSKTIRASVAFLRYAKESKLVYISHLEGIDVCEPDKGDVICAIRHGEPLEGIGPVEVYGNKIYALTGNGYIYASRHPVSQ
jgi:outer membrane protein assembly factor BamB